MMRPRENLGLLDVIENLNTIVGAESLDDIEVTEGFLFIRHEEGKEGYWTPAGNNQETLDAIKITFRSAHKYLHSLYHKIQNEGESKSILDGINTIMVLVGETKKKFEKFNKLIAENITQLPEYKDIENFYRARIIKEIKPEEAEEMPQFIMPNTEDEWDSSFEELFKEAQEEEYNLRLLNDIEAVKHDYLYELFYLKDANGQPFYSNELARNIKLACDFGQYSAEKYTHDPLTQISRVQDKGFQNLASKMLKALKEELKAFYREAYQHKDIDLSVHLHNASMALMLASNPHNLVGKKSPKGCHAYFFDFQIFLRQALHDREYQNFTLYASSSLQEKPFFRDLINLIYGFCFQLFKQNTEHKEVAGIVSELTGKSQEKKLSKFMESSYGKLQEALKHHPSGPVFKALDLIREEQVPSFDPMMLGNIAEMDSTIKTKEREIPIYRSPSPTKQEYAHLAEITEEFKTFLYALSEKREHEHYLIFNFQDRTSWREHARVHVLEELSRNALFVNVLSVVTLAKDTDFYQQIGTYHNLTDASQFIQQFFEHLQDESTGYYFPAKIKEQLFPHFAKELLETIHNEIFESKKELSFHARLDFIELAYLLLELKIIEIVKPTIISHLSKDGLDTASTATAALLVLLKVEKESHEKMNARLLGPTLIERERAIHPERFERLLSLVNVLENKELKNISRLYAKETWHMKAEI